jgi:hypothetical protein
MVPSRAEVCQRNSAWTSVSATVVNHRTTTVVYELRVVVLPTTIKPASTGSRVEGHHVLFLVQRQTEQHENVLVVEQRAKPVSSHTMLH